MAPAPSFLKGSDPRIGVLQRQLGPTALSVPGIITPTKGQDCSSSVGFLCTLWVQSHWCFCSSFSRVQEQTTSSLLFRKLQLQMAQDQRGNQTFWRRDLKDLSNLPCIKQIFKNLFLLVTGMTPSKQSYLRLSCLVSVKCYHTSIS